MDSKYIQGRLIGAGTYAKVYEAMDTETGKVVALKKIAINEKEGMPSTALREISILKNIKHDNIIRIQEVIHREDHLTIVFEYIDFDLMGYINRYGNVMCLINQLISGIHHLHTRKIVHRDLKPQNILVNTRGVLKIADFGLARSLVMTENIYSSEVVTLWYRAPELLMGSTNYGCEIDIWSTGCIIYEMITRKPLLAGSDSKMQFELCKRLNLQDIEKELKREYRIPEIIITIITRCLNTSPTRRITADEIVTLLEDEYDKE